MCGITGFVGEGKNEDLERMIGTLSHRGPDDKGSHFIDGVGLGHTRLSIIDLSPTGHQPMFSSDKNIGIVFNGEIYNFKELKEDLSKEGYVFKGTSDTEVIIALYQKFGENCFEKMNGMFAIAIYDFIKGDLLISRDRLGKKPLYWALFDKTLIFGSELKALLCHPMCKKEIDINSLNLYLQLDYVPTPKSIFKNIYKLEPATYLSYKSGVVSKKAYWLFESKVSSIDFVDAINGLNEKINMSVKRRLVSDVPIGIFLSGGLDSSTVAYYAQKNTKEKIHTFSIGFSEKSFDESKYALEVSKILKTNHHHKNLSAKDTLDLMPTIADILDEPMADASVIPTYLLSAFAKTSVTVALGGDGGDELFAGYPTFQADKIASIYKILPLFVRDIIKNLVNILPATENNFGLIFNLKKTLNGIESDKFFMHQKWLGSFDGVEVSGLLKNGNNKPGAVFNYCEEIKSGIKIEDKNNKLLAFYMRTYMMDEVMVKVDRASMKAGLETRSPFLDFELVEYVSTLSYSFKLKGFTTKYILKKLMSGKLPDEIVWRKKKGFGVPLANWLKNELKPLCEDLLSRKNIESQGLFNYEYIAHILDDHFLGKQDNRKKIWNLMVFQMWYKKYYLD